MLKYWSFKTPTNCSESTSHSRDSFLDLGLRRAWEQSHLYGGIEYCEQSRLYQPWTNRLYQPVVIAVRCMPKDLSILRPEISQTIRKANKHTNSIFGRIINPLQGCLFHLLVKNVGCNSSRSLLGLDAHACQSFFQEIFQNVPPFRNFVSPFPATLSLNFALPLSSCVLK